MENNKNATSNQINDNKSLLFISVQSFIIRNVCSVRLFLCLHCNELKGKQPQNCVYDECVTKDKDVDLTEPKVHKTDTLSSPPQR